MRTPSCRTFSTQGGPPRHHRRHAAAREIIDQSPMDEYRVAELSPGRIVSADADWLAPLAPMARPSITPPAPAAWAMMRGRGRPGTAGARHCRAAGDRRLGHARWCRENTAAVAMIGSQRRRNSGQRPLGPQRHRRRTRCPSPPDPDRRRRGTQRRLGRNAAPVGPGGWQRLTVAPGLLAPRRLRPPPAAGRMGGAFGWASGSCAAPPISCASAPMSPPASCRWNRANPGRGARQMARARPIFWTGMPRKAAASMAASCPRARPISRSGAEASGRPGRGLPRHGTSRRGTPCRRWRRRLAQAARWCEAGLDTPAPHG